jgi:hypothetical protein
VGGALVHPTSGKEFAVALLDLRTIVDRKFAELGDAVDLDFLTDAVLSELRAEDRNEALNQLFVTNEAKRVPLQLVNVTPPAASLEVAQCVGPASKPGSGFDWGPRYLALRVGTGMRDQILAADQSFTKESLIVRTWADGEGFRWALHKNKTK